MIKDIFSSNLFNVFSRISKFSTVNLIKTNENNGNFLHVSVPRNLFIENMIVKGRVDSKIGNIKASNCTLEIVNTPGNIDLVNSSAQSLFSRGKITVKQTDRINSCFRSITAKRSSLSDVFANHDVHLINSSAKSVFANHDVHLINSSAKNVDSGFGCITIKQLDGTNRTISEVTAIHGSVVADHCHITGNVKCRQKAVITNSQINGLLSLVVDPRHQGVLDLTQTQIDGPISITVCNPMQIYGEPVYGPPPKECSIFIKGSVDLKRVIFDWKLCYEVSYQQTDEGLLITGKKMTPQNLPPREKEALKRKAEAATDNSYKLLEAIPKTDF